ncbi:hypothetical protein CLOSTMETH_00746 [[Clostridium] methylpentosum DSM 5476]|uniref:Uncharacterized protein n=1 Tax=[Clostridium] methylpentosum DSM 5476 TaxID=537013 RepID=C0EA92_9FIRM|nr:hypothetical protein CLOSTMETH_00746 [[Clostridium] methylpentosum DSM 5476]
MLFNLPFGRQRKLLYCNTGSQYTAGLRTLWGAMLSLERLFFYSPRGMIGGLVRKTILFSAHLLHLGWWTVPLCKLDREEMDSPGEAAWGCTFKSTFGRVAIFS